MQLYNYLRLRDVDENRRASLLSRFFSEIYREAFPVADQAEEPSHWLPLMRNANVPSQPSVHIILAIDVVDRIVGGIIFEYYRGSNFWLLAYIAVLPSRRRMGIATGLIAEMCSDVAGHSSGDWTIISEATDPKKTVDSTAELEARSRLYAFDAWGFRRAVMQYTQPALGDSKFVARDFFLLFRTSSEGAPVQTSQLTSFLKEFYRSYGQSRADSLAEMIKELAGGRTVVSMPIFPQ